MSVSEVPKGYEGNAPEIDQQFAVKAVEQAVRAFPGSRTHAENRQDVYWKLLETIEASKIRLTKHDDELYSSFKDSFPEYFENDLKRVRKIDEDKLKSSEEKPRWRKWLKRWETDIADYNFGTLLRVDAADEFTERNAMFTVRAQALAFEVTRLRHGMNDWIQPKKLKEGKK